MPCGISSCVDSSRVVTIEMIPVNCFTSNISRFFFPESIQNVGAECFAECPYLNNLWIPPNVHIGQNAFADCQSLKRVQVAGTVPAEVIDTWGLNEDCTIERYEI